MFPVDDPVGKDIRIGELHFTVIGVFQERVATFGQSEITGKSVIVPFSLIQYYTGEESTSGLFTPRRTVPKMSRASRARWPRFCGAATAPKRNIWCRI